MATALLWADLDRQQTNQVYSVQPWTYDTVTSLLANFLEDLDTSTPTGEILAKYYFINLRLAVESQFSAEKTSTLFSVLKLTHFTSMDRCLTADQSMQEMKNLLIEHSVERPPYSVGIFSSQDIKRITDHVADNYYRHYKLYRYIFTKKRVLDFSIKADSVELPPPMKPLQEATTEADVRAPDIEKVAEEDPKVLTEEEAAAVTEKEDEDLLNNPKTDMIQKLVAKRLESVKEKVEEEFKEQEEVYKARIAELEAKVVGS